MSSLAPVDQLHRALVALVRLVLSQADNIRAGGNKFARSLAGVALRFDELTRSLLPWGHSAP